MRRTIFLALVAALLIVVPAARAADSKTIIRDCQDDSQLQGHYTLSELRKARTDLPTDVDEYSDCRDVLSRAISAATSSDSSGGGGGGNAGGGGGSNAGGTGGGSGQGSGTTGNSRPKNLDPAVPATPDTLPDRVALGKALTQGGNSVDLSGKRVIPGGQSRLAADVGRNALPTTLILVLALLAAAALAAAAPPVRHRALRHRQQ